MRELSEKKITEDGSVYLPTLYKKNSKGKLQYWNISVIPNPDHSTGWDIWIAHGQVGGKEQESVDSILEGKNIGKANETTPYTQAVSEAASKWTKQIDRKGYVKNKEDVDKDTRPGVEAMLAHRYDKYPEKISFPCFIQPKLDGHRCLAVVIGGKCTLYSRQRKEITGLPHINEIIEGYCKGSGISDITLDGELYNHDYKHKFEELTGFIRSEKPKEGYDVVQYHIYDVVMDEKYEDRYTFLDEFFRNLGSKVTLVPVETLEVTQEQVVSQFKSYLAQGYEGAILRDKSTTYEHKRSYGLQKVKEFEDAEFEIIGVEEGRGSMKGHAIFVCKTTGGHDFKAKMKGSMDELVKIFNEGEKYIGNHLTVQYQGLTKEGIPRFPVGLRVREEV